MRVKVVQSRGSAPGQRLLFYQLFGGQGGQGDQDSKRTNQVPP